MSNNSKKLCISCSSAISLGAQKCPICSDYQSHWKNRLKYFSGIVGIITISISALAFLLTKAPEVRKSIFWSDNVEVIFFSEYMADVAIVNSGDGSIIVTNIETTPIFDGKEISSSSISVYKEIAPGETYMGSIGLNGTEFSIPTDLNKEDVKKIVHDETIEKCYKFFTLSQNHYMANTLKELNNGSNLFEAKAFVNFYSGRNKKNIKLPFPAVSLIGIKDDCKIKHPKID